MFAAPITRPAARPTWATAAVKALKDRGAALIANHGMVAVGPTPDKVLHITALVERSAQIVYGARAIGSRPTSARVGRRRLRLHLRRVHAAVRVMAEREAVIVDVVRTAFGKRKGALSNWHPTDLLGFTLRSMTRAQPAGPGTARHVVGGCITQSGEQACNFTRNAVIAGGLPWTMPATTVDRQCGSSQQAMHFVAGVRDERHVRHRHRCGAESMTRVPMASNARGGTGPFSPAFMKAIDDQLWAQFRVAQVLADESGTTREEMDAVRPASHQRAAEATNSGHFAKGDPARPDQGRGRRPDR